MGLARVMSKGPPSALWMEEHIPEMKTSGRIRSGTWEVVGEEGRVGISERTGSVVGRNGSQL